MKITLKTILFLLITNCASAQSTIVFETNLTWQQVLAKAKAEHKYIFVDCYATWCGPCKLMEETVYNQKSVADIYNSRFINVKLQMDKTADDNDAVKSWYETAATLGENYNVNAYPTFLFFDENGMPMHRYNGAINADDFIKLAADAENPARQYYHILKHFEKGKLDTGEERRLAIAFYSIDRVLAGKLATDYFCRLSKVQLQKDANRDLLISFRKDSLVRRFVKDYIDHLEEIELYQQPNIQLMLYFTQSSKDRGFGLFYLHANKVDAVLQHHGLAQELARTVIETEDWTPLLDSAKNTAITPDFKTLYRLVLKKYNARYAHDVELDAKLSWYSYLARIKKMEPYWPQYISARIAKMERFRYDTVKAQSAGINNICWEIFQHDSLKFQLDIASRWMKNIVNSDAENPNYMDTYACLLYRAVHKEQAIEWETKALIIYRGLNSNNDIEYTNRTIEKMRKNEEIWKQKGYMPN